MLSRSHSSSRLGLRASRGSEYSRLGSSRRSRTGSTPLRFFWSSPSLVPALGEGGGEDGRVVGSKGEGTDEWEK